MHGALNRLLQVAEGLPLSQGGVPVPVEDYAYDGEGNRTASHLSAAHLSSDHNQLLEDDNYTYAYDARGNRISRTSKATGDVETYSYDSQNRLTGYSSPDTTATYAYDALDRRIAKTVDGVVTAYVYDMSPDDPLAYDDITLEFTDGILTRRWSHSDAVDEPLGFEAYASQSGVGSGAEHAIYTDRQGSVIWVTDPATGAVVAGYEYDAYGQITQIIGTLKQPYGYTGREFDAESGLYHYRARAYDPVAGVFLQVDPIEFGGGELNLHGMVGQNLPNFSDPTGLWASKEFADIGPSNSANGLAATTYISVGVVTAAGSIAQRLSSISVYSPGQYSPPVWGRNTGTCNAAQHSALQAIVDAAKGTSACLPIPSTFLKNVGITTRLRLVNLNKMHGFSRLAIARATINATCFGGGDKGHSTALDEALGAMENCRNIIVYNTAKPKFSE